MCSLRITTSLCHITNGAPVRPKGLSEKASLHDNLIIEGDNLAALSNRARKDYYVQGWRRGKIYADFVFTLRTDEVNDDAFHQVFVVETKGLHLKDSDDTDYRRISSTFAPSMPRRPIGRISSR